MEVNLLHGDPVAIADQAFLFKRTVRETALRHKMYASFMAKPMEKEPGSAMHIHQSVVSLNTGENIFSNDGGEASSLFLCTHWWAAALPAAVAFAPRAECQFIPASHPLSRRTDKRPMGTR